MTVIEFEAKRRQRLAAKIAELRAMADTLESDFLDEAEAPDLIRRLRTRADEIERQY
jgi:hypothetical protein